MFKHVNALLNLHFLNNYYVQQSFAFFVKKFLNLDCLSQFFWLNILLGILN
jgi:hypothetical protein